MAKPALFLDRDGVINIDHGYQHCIEGFEFVSGIFSLCQRFKRHNYELIVVTNQSGIARGYYSEQDFADLTSWMKTQFSQRNVPLSGVYYSPYHPQQGLGKYKKDSDCRKPKPGMLLQAAQDLEIDLHRSVMVGDSFSDMQAAYHAGVPTRYLFSNMETLEGISEQVSFVRVKSLEKIKPSFD
jgi:D-glycero-D-manno-heptose 1,7-bisphosphate phosphatase